MKLKKLGLIATTAVIAFSLVACQQKKASEEESEPAKQEATTQDEAKVVENLDIDKEKQQISLLCEVNGTYFTEPTRHGVVFKDGSNGEKAILRGLVSEKDIYQALIDIGAEPGDNLTKEDMSAKAGEGKSVEGQKLDITVKWDGQEEIPFSDIIKCDQDYTTDFRFGGNIESANKNNTGCIICLDSCATGIVSDAAWPTGSTQNKTVTFYGNDKVLPADGTKVTVTIKIAK